MKHRIAATCVRYFRLGALCIALPVLAQSPKRAHASAESDAGTFETRKQITAADSPEAIMAKAATVLPRQNQTDWMRLERTFFIHFGPNTFRSVEWGTGHEDPSIFNPSQLSADQWMRSVKEGGGKLVVLVCKHHDGFTVWPSRYTAHSVAASPWRGGHGDEVREVAQAARKYGIELGVYLSPADLYQLHTNTSNPKGYYGDGSAKRVSTIPTDPASFLTDPSKRRSGAVSSQTFSYPVDDYNRYFLNQLYELLTEYGPIHEVWFDGANPDRSVTESYEYAAWYDMIRKLQPKAMIFGKGPDARWVGNEKGLGRETEWDVIPLPSSPEDFRWPDMTDQDLAGLSKLVPGSTLWWYPPETDAPILHGWFWSPTKECRTTTELVDMYYTSVGRNSSWILNISPDTRGLIPDNQLAQLRGMSGILNKTFAVDLAQGSTVSADSSTKGHGASGVLDGNLDTWWQAAAGTRKATLVFKLSRAATFDVISLQEAVDQRGQRVASFGIDMWNGGAWQQIQKGTTIGHKRLLRLDRPVTASQVRLRIEDARLEPTIAEIGLYKQPTVTAAPAVSDRDAHGMVTVTTAAGGPMVYTTDGSMPHTGSARYAGPIDMSQGGTVQAATLSPGRGLSLIAEKHFIGLVPMGWNVVPAAGGSGNATAAIDGDDRTVWEAARASAKDPFPDFTVDMGTLREIQGFAYLPRQDGGRKGLVEHYRFETSVDGRQWEEDVPDGRFDNIRNNPVYQEVLFPPTQARFFRFTPLDLADKGDVVSAGEITVIGRRPAE